MLSSAYTALAEPPFAVSDAVVQAMRISLAHCDELLPQADWWRKLARSEATGIPLRIKLGLDQIGRAHV